MAPTMVSLKGGITCPKDNSGSCPAMIEEKNERLGAHEEAAFLRRNP